MLSFDCRWRRCGPDTHPLARDTPFRRASPRSASSITQVAIGQLLQEGKLKPDASVRAYLPELPEAFAPITITQLLHHRSSVSPMTRADMADAPTMAGANTARHVVALIASKPLAFAAGSRDEYANGGYLLLGAVIEAASGLSYRDSSLTSNLRAPTLAEAQPFHASPASPPHTDSRFQLRHRMTSSRAFRWRPRVV